MENEICTSAYQSIILKEAGINTDTADMLYDLDDDPVKFKPIKVEITDEKEKKKILSQLDDIKTKSEKNDVFHLIRLLNSNYDNIDIYTYNSKTYYVEYNDDTPNDKHLLIEMEYDITAEKVTSKVWKTIRGNTFQHGRSIKKEFEKVFKE